MTAEQRTLLQLWLPLIVLTVLVLAVGLYDNTFFSASNFLSVTADTMTLFLMASGVTLVIPFNVIFSMMALLYSFYLYYLGATRLIGMQPSDATMFAGMAMVGMFYFSRRDV